MNEVNELLNRLGELEDAPLIWINKKVYDMAQEIKRLNNRVNELEKAVSRKEEEITDLRDEIIDLESKIDESIEYIEENKRTYENDEYCFDDMIDEVTPLLNILKGNDKE